MKKNEMNFKERKYYEEVVERFSNCCTFIGSTEELLGVAWPVGDEELARPIVDLAVTWLEREMEFIVKKYGITDEAEKNELYKYIHMANDTVADVFNRFKDDYEYEQ